MTIAASLGSTSLSALLHCHAGHNISEALADTTYSQMTAAMAALLGPDSAVVAGESEGRAQDAQQRQEINKGKEGG